MNYLSFKNAKEKAFNAFLPKDMFFAFSEKQFLEGCEKIHAKKNRRGKYMISRIPGGGFINNSAIPSWRMFWKNWDRREALSLDDKFIITGLIYEYGNHEAQICRDSKKDAEEIFPYATEEHKRRAWRIFWRDCVRNDRF